MNSLANTGIVECNSKGSLMKICVLHLFLITLCLISGDSSVAQEQFKLSASERLAYSTVRIEVQLANGIGTGKDAGFP